VECKRAGHPPFQIPFEDLLSRFGFGDHKYSYQLRFGGLDCSRSLCENSPHISVPYDPKAGVPGFHVDAHGDVIHHGIDVNRKSVE
jgi:hypothetical protein